MLAMVSEYHGGIQMLQHSHPLWWPPILDECSQRPSLGQSPGRAITAISQTKVKDTGEHLRACDGQNDTWWSVDKLLYAKITERPWEWNKKRKYLISQPNADIHGRWHWLFAAHELDNEIPVSVGVRSSCGNWTRPDWIPNTWVI